MSFLLGTFMLFLQTVFIFCNDNEYKIESEPEAGYIVTVFRYIYNTLFLIVIKAKKKIWALYGL